MKARGIAIAGAALSVLAVVVLARAFDADVALATVRRAEPAWALAAGLAYVALFPLRGLRWSVLLRDVRPVRVGAATEVFAIGFLANNVLPARLGDVARAFVLADRAGIPASTSFANILLERIFDGLTVVALLLAVLGLAPPPTAAWTGTLGLWTGVAFGLAVLVAFVLAQSDALARRAVALATRPLPASLRPKVEALALRLLAGVLVLRNPTRTLAVVALSLAVWALEVGVYVLLARAFHLALDPSALTLTMAVLTLGLTAPSAPAFVGVFEGLVVAALALYGVGTSEATAFAIGLHLVHFVPGTALGLWAAARMGIRVRELGRPTITPPPPA